MLLFGVASYFDLALMCIAFAGTTDEVSAVVQNLIIKREVTDELRGRLSAIRIGVINTGPRLGNAAVELVAGAF